MNRLLAEEDITPTSLVSHVLAAVCFAVAGYLHVRLFYGGYREVAVVGPLFLLNGVGTLVALLFLVLKRIALYALGVLTICVGAIVSILISHSTSFFGFAEGGYDATATVIVATEIAAVVLVTAGLLLNGRRQRAAAPRAEAVTA